MKILISTLLLLSFLNVSASYSDSDYDKNYRTNADGSTSYIGKCKLHEDYEDKLYRATEVVPYTEETDLKFFASLNPLYQELSLLVYLEELHFEENVVHSYKDFDYSWGEYTFDDITIDYIELFGGVEGGTVHRVRYGVGGGNGGYMSFFVDYTGTITLIAHTFDGDMNYCHKAFMR